MNIAILLGVPEYTGTPSDLPACSNDVSLVEGIISRARKFDATLSISDRRSSAEVKAQLAKFISDQKGNKIEELLFYYTGHGDLMEDEFFYLLSDYSKGRRNATSLANGELDAMLRSLAPEITVKVVDACHAGVAYVKEPDALEKHLEESKQQFKKCYFMFSSQAEEKSWQGSHFSDFTKSFATACETFDGQQIRYKDIISEIADDFSENPAQTPVFVTQADFVEVFCVVTEELKSYIRAQLSGSPGSGPEASVSRDPKTLQQIARSQAEQYCTREEVLGFLTRLQEHLKAATLPPELRELFDLHVTFGASWEELGNTQAIGRWLSENPGDYLAEAQVSWSIKHGTSREVIRVQLSAEVPFEWFRLRADPRLENIGNYSTDAVFVFSKKEFVLFYRFEMGRKVGWEECTWPGDGRWTFSKSKMKEDPEGKQLASAIISRFGEFLLVEVKKVLGLADDEDTGEEGPGDDEPTGA